MKLILIQIRNSNSIAVTSYFLTNTTYLPTPKCSVVYEYTPLDDHQNWQNMIYILKLHNLINNNLTI